MAKAMINAEAELRKCGYTLGMRLDEGAYSTVREGFRDNKKVAIKIVNKMKCEEEFREKFLPRELEIVSTLSHPNIVQVFDIFHIQDLVFIVMEYAGKDNLHSYISSRGKLPEQQAKEMMSNIIGAVDYLHTNGIVHRDVKCGNILINQDDELKLTDFGFARAITPGEFSETYCGSLAYSAPEVLSKKPYDPTLTDIWGIGVITYMMVCGKLPYTETNMKRMITAQLGHNMVLPSELSANLKVLIKSILHPDVDRRFRLKDIITHPWFTEGDTEQDLSGDQNEPNNSEQPGCTKNMLELNHKK